MEIAALVCNDKLDYEAALKTYSIFHTTRKMGNQIQIVDYNYLDLNTKNIFDKVKNNNLYDFLENNTIFTSRRYNSYEQLEDSIPLADSYMLVNPNFSKLDTFPRERCVVYGVKDIDKNEINMLKDDYKKFSTNEEVIGAEVSRVVDPLFLLSKEDWYEFGEKSSLPDENKEYVLIYSKVVEKDMLMYAKNLSERNNSKILIVSDKVNSLLYKGKRIQNATPADLVKLISNASDVITSNDDGIRLSIIFEKRIHIFNDSNDENQLELINELKLIDRIVTSQDRVILKESENKEAIDKIKEIREQSLKLFE